MRLWISFASNHSSDYSIVGTFKTENQAEKAQREINSWIRLQLKRADMFGLESGGESKKTEEEAQRRKRELEKKWGKDVTVKVQNYGTHWGVSYRFDSPLADWEDDYEFERRGKKIKINFHTAGYGIDQLMSKVRDSGGKARLIDLEGW